MAAHAGFTPIERRVVRLSEDGVSQEEIARRFRRTPKFIGRVLTLAQTPRRGSSQRPEKLRPLERRVLKWRADGVSATDIASRFRRQPRTIEQIERLARYKQAKS